MLVDRYGARRILIAGGTITAAGLIGAAFAPNVYWYGAMLFVAGVGGAGVPVAGMTSLLREFAPEERGMALGWRQLAVPLGGAVGSVALPALVSIGGLRLAMLVSAVAAGGLAFGFAAVAGDDRSEVRSRGLGGVLSIPQMRQLLTVGFLYVWGLGGVLAYYIPAAESGGLSATQAAIGFTVVNITAALSRIVWGRLADKNSGTRRIHVLRATGLVAAAGAVLMPIALATGTVTSSGRDRGPGVRGVRLQRGAVPDRRRDRRRRPRRACGRAGLDGGIRLGFTGRADRRSGDRSDRLRRRCG